MTTRGGAREGAGRKPIAPGGTVRATVTLPADALDLLRELGEGNVSEGVRLLVERHLSRRLKR